MNPQYYAHYSKQAAEQYGTIFYTTPDGQIVEVTNVYRDGQEAGYMWSDKRRLGPVDKYVCQGRRGNTSMIFCPYYPVCDDEELNK